MSRYVKITGSNIADVLAGTALKDKIRGRGGDDVINGDAGADRIKGGHGNDLITGGGGNDTIDGGKGIDVAVYRGLFAQYALRFTRNGDLDGTVTDLVPGRDGMDSLKKVEFLLFGNAVYDVQNDVVYVLNHAPVVANPIPDRVTLEDTAFSFTVPDNTFSDADSDTLTYTAALADGGVWPAWLQFDAGTGAFSGTPPQDFNGFVDVRVTASDGQASAFDDFRLTIAAVNDAPTAMPDVLASVAEDSGPLSIAFTALTGNDSRGPSNESGQTLTASAVGSAVGGTVAIVNGHVQFTLTPDFNGTASFDYTLTDDGTTNGLPDTKSAVGHASFAVTPVNDAPTVAVSPLQVDVDENEPLQVVTAAMILSAIGASDVDGDSLSVRNFALFDPAGHPISLNPAPQGVSVTFNPDGSLDTFTFDPAGYSFLNAGETMTPHIEFDVSDGHGGSVHGAAFITFHGVANTPAIVNDPPISNVTEDEHVVAGNLQASGDIEIIDPDPGEAFFVGGAVGFPGNRGTLDLQPNGDYTYSVANAAVQFLGANENSTDSFMVTTLDGTSRGVAFTVHGVNDPVLIAGGLVNGSFEFINAPPFPSHALSLAGGSTLLTGWTVIPAGIDYVEVGYQDSIPADGGAYIDLAGSTFGVGGYAGGVEQTVNTIAGSRYLVQFAQSGNPDGGAVERIRVSAAGQSQDYTFDTAGHAWTDLGWVERQFVFTATAPTTTLSFRSLDGDFMGPLLDKVRLAPMNTLTELVGTPSPSQPDFFLAGNLAYSDADTSDVHFATGPAGPTPATSGRFGPFSIAATDNVGGGAGVAHWEYHVAASALEFLADGEHYLESLDVSITDGHGGAVLQNVVFDFVGTNDAPVIQSGAVVNIAFNGTIGLPGQTSLVIPTNFNFSDPDYADHHTAIAMFNAAASNSAQIGSLVVTALDDTTLGTGGLVHAQFDVNPAVLNAVAPNANIVNVWDIPINDGHGGVAVGRVIVNVNAQTGNPAPVAHDDFAVGSEDAPIVTPNVLANDTDDAPLTFASVATFGNGVFGNVVYNHNGTFTYHPLLNFFGSDSFSYTISDGALSATADVHVTVNPVNDAPVGQPDTYSVISNLNIAIPTIPGVLTNDTDAESDSLHAVLLSSTAHGALSFNADGSFVYTPAPNFIGNDGFTYAASDGTANSAPVPVTIVVTAGGGPIGGPPGGGGGGGGNPAPLAMPDTYFVGEAGVIATVLHVDGPGVLANDFDTEPLSAQLVLLSGPSHARDFGFTFDLDGSFTYSPEPYFVSYTVPGQQLVQSDSFQYRAYDGTSYSAPTTVTINVTPPPHVHVNTYAYDMQGTYDATSEPMRKFYDDLALGNPVFTPGIPGGPVPMAPENAFTVNTATQTYIVRGSNLMYDAITHVPTGGTINGLELLGPTPGFPQISLQGASTGVEAPWQPLAADFAQGLEAYSGPGHDPSGLDTLFQAVRYDIIDAGPPLHSVIVGGPFGDELRGAAGADTLYGGPGDDVLSGGASSGDIATGGPGADRFEFGGADGTNEVITDFSGVVGGQHDVIDLRAFTGPNLTEVAHTFLQVMAHTRQDGLDTVIDYTGTLGVLDETVVRLQSFDIANLRAGDFLYAPSSNLPPVAVNDTATAVEGVIKLIDVLTNDFDPSGDTLILAGVQRLPSDAPGASALTNAGSTVTVVGNQVQYDPTTSPTISGLLPAMPFSDNFFYTLSDGHGGFATANVTVSIMGT